MKPNPKSAKPNAYGLHQVATRLSPARYDALQRIAARRGARSLNAAVGLLIDEEDARQGERDETVEAVSRMMAEKR